MDSLYFQFFFFLKNKVLVFEHVPKPVWHTDFKCGVYQGSVPKPCTEEYY